MTCSPPLVSVVIPTAGARPALLIRAIDSARAKFRPEEIEVIVVPNGPKERWGSTIQNLHTRGSVRISPIAQASANAARNHGLRKARGRFVRFLDDDDFLLPDVAVKQCRELLSTGADISSYAIRLLDENRHLYTTFLQPDTEDFTAAQLGPNRLQLTHAHVYRMDLIRNLKWNENYPVSEDIAWLHAIVRQGEVNWIKSQAVVGVWYQHRGPRLSYAHAAHEPSRITAESILETVEVLRNNGRSTDARHRAAAAGLWNCVHRSFFLHPRHWHAIARQARVLDPDSHPDIGFYSRPMGARLNPLAVEWFVLPKRLVQHLLRQLKACFVGWNYVRGL